MSVNESVHQGMKQTGANYISLWIKKPHIITICSDLKNKKTNIKRKKKKPLQWKVCPGVFFFLHGSGYGGRHCTFKIYSDILTYDLVYP